LRPLGTRGVDLAAVEAGALLGVAQQVVGRRHLLELLLCLGIAGIEVGMQLLGEAAVSLLNLLLRGVALDSQNLVRISAAHCPSRARARWPNRSSENSVSRSSAN
jgi:hypothetical protein